MRLMMDLAKVGMNIQVCCLLLLTLYVTADLDTDGSNEGRIDSVDTYEDFYFKDRQQFDSVTQNDDEYHKQPEKRGLRAFIFGAAIIASLTNVGVDIYLGNGGCCEINKKDFPDACKVMKKIKENRKVLTDLGKKIDAIYLQSQKDITFLSDIDSKGDKISGQINRLRDLEEEIMLTMEPRLLNMYKDKAAEIKVLLEKGKEKITTASPLNVTDLYTPLYKSWRGRAILMSGVGLNILGELGEFLVDRVTVHRVKKTLEPELRMRITLNNRKANGAMKARQLLGGTDSIDDLLKSMARVEIAKTQTNTKMRKAAKLFGTVVSLAAIGFEVYELYTKIKICTAEVEKKDQISKDLVNAIRETNKTLKVMEEARKNITDQYATIKKSMLNASVVEVIEDFRTVITTAAPAARRRMHLAETNIGVYLKYTAIANPSLFSSLQTFLFDGLKTMRIRYDCLLKRSQLISGTTTDCASGLDTLPKLYEKHAALKLLHKCQTDEGEKFTTLEQMKKFVADDIKNITVAKDKYHASCMLNNKHLVERLCREICVDRQTYATVLKSQPTITESELKDICQPNNKCPARPLTPGDKEKICSFKLIGISLDKMVKVYKANSPAEVTDAYNKCK